MTKKLEINSDQEMQQLGYLLAANAQPHDLLLLTGDLGAGKTTMTKGLARNLGIKRPVKSPTFTIVREYKEGKMPLYHMDMYRLEDGDLSSIDLPSYLAEPGIVVIEWPQFIIDSLPDDYLELQLKRVDDSWDSTKRIVEPIIKGKRNKAWWQAVVSQLNK
ncbi:tRNA threonylcarbamoyladenosine biosynthesis protein TsaE [Lactobacillus colini]|uniref:tRNA threonylcarbamoyladenosine biosynthesis protein TsaE n=1 Tax=Lactobacillus colini TaxID=1819254 RepID=A0ABS4MDD8_9LACO|nr:tRNA (adenosine(37)-N6)-threonylcarbamoyltransferase complex ATPase subunit type 1 TsaE [Lactobacillus colini]MBP2057699.1 tRNA threonylcarbamoyladenosine biosynthesis protein TsaE [Lactobacillus colini]